jgi:hypothetical protein
MRAKPNPLLSKEGRARSARGGLFKVPRSGSFMLIGTLVFEQTAPASLREGIPAFLRRGMGSVPLYFSVRATCRCGLLRQGKAGSAGATSLPSPRPPLRLRR